MKRKTIIFGLLLTTLLFGGCGRNMDSQDNNATQDINNTTESSQTTDMATTPEPTAPTSTIEPLGNDNTDANMDIINPSDTMDGVTENNNDTANSNTTMLTEQEAKQIALKKVPGATEDDIKKFKKDTDDSIVEYEGEIHYNGKEYEFEIHAYNGTILEWDEEPLQETAR